MDEKLREKLKRLFDEQSLCVLSTHDEDGQPYANIVAYAVSDDLKWLIFATPKETKKFYNLQSDSRAAMLVDNSKNVPEDIDDAMAVTVTGEVEQVNKDGEEARVYLAKHGNLLNFLESADSVLMKLNVGVYHVVETFQKTTRVSSDQL